ncbi:hypothetical protein D6827_01980 [Candidatus Parcubacteria bacterium]|nr:MAG: hypothetical protein D6827_01980 [Candidatus Parcubacteria bacterium]
MKSEYKLMVLGARCQRLALKDLPNPDMIARLDLAIRTIARDNPQIHAAYWIVKGRNFILKRRGMKQVEIK